MPKLIGVDEWIKQIGQQIDRLSGINCDKCLPEFMDRMIENKIISEWSNSDNSILYTIQGKEQKKEL